MQTAASTNQQLCAAAHNRCHVLRPVMRSRM
jgi:hypothetical protein